MSAPLLPELERVIISADEIKARISGLAWEIEADYAGVERILLIGVLKGSFIFLADLARELRIPHIVDFMAVSSYGKTVTSTGAVRLVLDLREPIENEHVILVEDIVDTGNTLDYLLHTLEGRNPASLRTCVFSRKVRTQLDVPVDYLGFEIPDVWVVGYGLDYANNYRTLPYVAELKPSVYQK
ncbi:MAG TPA: hypoxanthine phosphoribosyltransferase [Anaerolineales bacterium]|nr:hypoxanthine phosphoribosyltransferase [Anaerolineales bacterium]